jgi:VanZ family protein
MGQHSSNSTSAIRHPPSAISRATLYYWLPPFLWMAVMFYFSTDTFSAANTGSRLQWVVTIFFPAITESQLRILNFLTRKTAHFVEYAILALLWLRAFRSGAPVRWRWRWAAQAFALVAVWALLDEWHQTYTAHRGGSLYDSLLDMCGGLTALIVAWVWQGRHNSKATA